jgi:hypothetical protein
MLGNVISASISCRRCRCRAIYDGPLDVLRTTECVDCRHPLFGDHTITTKGVFAPALQFVILARIDKLKLAQGPTGKSSTKTAKAAPRP